MNSAKHIVTYDQGILIKQNGEYVPYAEMELQRKKITWQNRLEQMLQGCPSMLEIIRGKI